MVHFSVLHCVDNVVHCKILVFVRGVIHKRERDVVTGHLAGYVCPVGSIAMRNGRVGDGAMHSARTNNRIAPCGKLVNQFDETLFACRGTGMKGI